MDMIEKLADTLRADLPEVAETARRKAAKQAGLGHAPETVRLTKTELDEAVRARATAIAPADPATIVAMLADDPTILDADVDAGDGTCTIATAVRDEIASRLVSSVNLETYRLLRDEYGAPDFGRVVEGILATLPNVAAADPDAARALESDCERQMGQRLPTSRGLLAPINRARRALVDRRRSNPDAESLADARTLFEIAFYIDWTGYRLDKTHVPAAADGPKP